MLAMLFFIFSTPSFSMSCDKPSQIKDLQAICDQARDHEDEKAQEPLACESSSPGNKVTGPTLKFNFLNAKSKLDALISGMNRRALQNGLPEKCGAPCTPSTRSITALRIQPASTNPTWKPESDKSCTNQYFGKSMVVKQRFVVRKNQSGKQNVQGQAERWVRNVMVHEQQADIEWNGRPSVNTTMIALCPDPCSYHSDQIFDLDERGANYEMTVTLNVTCARPRKGIEFQASGSIQVVKSCEAPQ